MSSVPAVSKIRQRLDRLDLSVNAFERAVKLGTGVGSRLLRGEYRPKVPAVLRIELWSGGDIVSMDWLTPEEAAELREMAQTLVASSKAAA